MRELSVTEQIRSFLEPKKCNIDARIFVSRDDGITVYDTIQNETTASVSALVSGVWQASEALVGLVDSKSDIMEFRLGFDTSSQGIYLFPFLISGKKYFLGVIYQNCVNPGFLKRQVTLIKQEIDIVFKKAKSTQKPNQVYREGYLFKDISDEEIDKLFSIGGI